MFEFLPGSLYSSTIAFVYTASPRVQWLPALPFFCLLTGLRMKLETWLHQYFGFRTFKSGQREAIQALHRHKAALAVFPTGGGKSLCYQLPALAYEGVTLVVSPLIALMKDQIDFLQGRGIPAARLDSSLSGEEAREVGERMRAGTLKLL